MSRDYNEVIDHINALIDSFNEQLKSFKINKLESNYDSNPKYLSFKGKEFTQYTYPANADKKGVYFFMGYNITEHSKTCLYIGKASNNNSIGSRLDNYLINAELQHHVDDYFHYKGNQLIAYLTFIDFPNEYRFFAPALEEFLILNWNNPNCDLLNSVGR